MKKEINGYIFNIEPNQVVDRDEYVDAITSILHNKNSSNIVIIVAKSAIGKSSLVSKILDNSKLEQTIIRVQTLPINDLNKTDEWEYFTLIFNSVQKIFEEGNYSFESYINSFKSSSNNKIILSYIIDNIFSNPKASLIMPIAYVIANWYFKLGRFDIDYLTNDNSLQSRRIKYQYIKYVFSNQNIILAIDNIQNIDKQSLLDLINIINETKNNKLKFIFEFTLTDDADSQDLCHKLGEKLSATSVKTEFIELEKLDKKYIVDAVSRHMRIPNKSWDFNCSLQEYYDKKNSGNIREMLDFSLLYSSEEKENNSKERYTLENIMSLPSEAKLLLSFIINANGSLSKAILSEIEEGMQLKTNEVVKLLKSKLVIEEKEYEYSLCHASLADEWNNCEYLFTDYNSIAFNELKRIYLNHIDILNKHSSMYDKAWLNLIQLISRYEPNKLIDLFQYIDNDCKKVISPQNAWTYIEQMLTVTKHNVTNYSKLYFKFIRFCFESELYKEGFGIIELLMKNRTFINNNHLVLWKAMYLSALDKHKENIIYCEEKLKNCNPQTKQYYNLKLISLSSYRSLGMIDECYKIHRFFVHDKKLKKEIEWGYFLRLTEMYLNRNESPKYLKKSINFFEKQNNIFQAGKSLISYSYILASQGKLSLALKKINTAQTYLKGKRMGNHMFLVNKAAICLLSGDYSENVWELLSESEITAVVPFDKLAIITNKLVWCIENKNSNRYSLLIKNATELLKKEPDYHIHGLIYYNIYYLLKQQDDPEAAEYLLKANEMKTYCKPVKARLDSSPTPETKFALTKPWHVCFLAYWTYDLNDI